METDADPAGVAVALALGVAIGAALALPALPPGGLGVAVGSVELDTVGTVLVVSALSVLLLPLGLFSLYQLFSLADR
ncbi:hypothetical protein DP107_06095 [Haloglomus irregulare]|jgi:hypothetical protein|uniref:Uncharacterized protein n=1 Tax=Haloglomus irregulare TaxID=2234134 RepID=A0A554NDH1_9EURY|nr:hypothetical protein [Haloglomus irregulare]TSD15408.1 hypothetical protein DP107_06095 [Haloglomus irregulare]